jgi:hypothetical protein
MAASRACPANDAEVLRRDQPVLGEDERALDGILQLTDVAGPRMREQQRARLAAQAGLLPFHLRPVEMQDPTPWNPAHHAVPSPAMLAHQRASKASSTQASSASDVTGLGR